MFSNTWMPKIHSLKHTLGGGANRFSFKGFQFCFFFLKVNWSCHFKICHSGESGSETFSSLVWVDFAALLSHILLKI